MIGLGSWRTEGNYDHMIQSRIESATLKSQRAMDEAVLFGTALDDEAEERLP